MSIERDGLDGASYSRFTTVKTPSFEGMACLLCSVLPRYLS